MKGIRVLGSRSWRNLDESAVRIRPGGSSSPRSRRRPSYNDAVESLVIAVDKGRYTCYVSPELTITAITAREIGRHKIVVGDKAFLVGDITANPGSLARIIRISPRNHILRRSGDDTNQQERVIVANADQIIIMSSVADPSPNMNFIDRCLVAAYDAGIVPILCLSKADLSPTINLNNIYRYYQGLSLRVIKISHSEFPHELLAALANKISVLFGQSGVGKSTLLNTIIPAAARSTAAVSSIGKGRHTSSSAIACPLPNSGWLVDTPGVRSFGLGHLTANHILQTFTDILPGSALCPSSCYHHSASTGCKLDEWVHQNQIMPERLESYRRLSESVDSR